MRRSYQRLDANTVRTGDAGSHGGSGGDVVGASSQVDLRARRVGERALKTPKIPFWRNRKNRSKVGNSSHVCQVNEVDRRVAFRRQPDREVSRWLPPLFQLAVNALRENTAAEIASLSGGDNFVTQRGLEQALQRVASHVPDYYLLSFQPTSSISLGLHSIRVRSPVTLTQSFNSSAQELPVRARSVSSNRSKRAFLIPGPPAPPVVGLPQLSGRRGHRRQQPRSRRVPPPAHRTELRRLAVDAGRAPGCGPRIARGMLRRAAPPSPALAP